MNGRLLIGMLLLAVFIGYMAWYLVSRVATNWMTSLAAVLGVLIGGLLLTMFGGGSDGLTFYPLGLVAGWLIYAAFRKFGGPGWPTVND